MFAKETERYDLRLDRPCIFVQTSQFPESTASVSGRLCLSLPKTAWIKSIKVRTRGFLKIPRDGLMITEDREEITHEKEQTLASSKTTSSFQILAGYYEFLFDIPLPANIVETSTGPGHHYHTYQVDAVIERRYWKNTVISQPFSVYKFPDIDTGYLTTDFPMAVEGQSVLNIQHSMSIPNSKLPFGSIFSVECGFAVPSKDIKLSTITLEVIEKHNIRLNATAAQAALQNIYSVTSSRSHIISKETHKITPETASISCTGTEWCISMRVCLPRSLNLCSQSVATKKFKITHFLTVTAEFQDENDQLQDKIINTIPFSIYITPEVLGPDGNICSKVIENNTHPPPPYGKHMCHVRLLESTETGSSEECMITVSSLERPSDDQPERPQYFEPTPFYDLAVDREPPVYTSVG